VIEGDHRFGDTLIRLIGIDPMTMPRQGQAVAISSASDLVGFLNSAGLLVVSQRTAERLSDVGSMTVKVAPDMPGDAAFVDIAVADRLLHKRGVLSRLVAGPIEQEDVAKIEKLTPELVYRPPGETPDVTSLTDSFHLNLTAFGFLAFIVGFFIVYSATGLSFEQRRTTFRTLRSLGVSLRALTILLAVELMLFALVSGILGVIIGYFLASALLPGVAATLRGLYGASVPGALALRPEWWLAGLGMALFGTALSSSQSLWRVGRMPILASGHQRAWARASVASATIQATGATLMLACAMMLGIFGSGLIAGFAVLGCLLLGAALILPLLLSAAISVAQRLARGPLTSWFWADTRQQLPGLSLALMALLLALSANIGVGTMVSSFRQTFLGWLDQRLAAELYVTARTEEEAGRLRDWLPARVRAVLPVWNAESVVLGQQLQIYGVVDDPTYRDHWPIITGDANLWDEVASGRGVLVNEQLWRDKKLKVGSTLAVNGRWEPRIVGVYSDYGNPRGQLIVGLDQLTEHYPDIPKLRYGLRIEAVNVSEVRKSLVQDFGLPDANIVDQASLKAQSRSVFEQTFVVTGALNILTLAVAGFAMFSSLLTLSGIRLPQLAPVWAMGLRRRDLGLLEVVRTVALWLATFVAAVPVGLALAWVLLTIVNVEAFGWRLPMQVFPLDWLKLGGIALAAALLSVLLPVRRLATVDPADLLRVFANER
jgi:putative ABC transport system permease protein